MHWLDTFWLKRIACKASLVTVLAALAASPALTADKPVATRLRHLLWTELVPPGWDPGKQVRDRLKGQDLNTISDSDPRMLQLMREMRDIWDKAPTNPAMDKAKGRLPGYVVPLEEAAEGMKEFLLVPYYGACIHSPPPPANQIVHVVSAKPVKGFSAMDTVWVTGTIHVERNNSYMGASDYRMMATSVDRYVKPAVQPAR